MINQRLLVLVTSFFMFANTRLYAMSQRHDITLTLIAIPCDSLCSNFGFLKTGLVEYIGVLQKPINKTGNFCNCIITNTLVNSEMKD